MRKDEIYNLLQKSKDKINLSNETISLNDSIEFLIKINIYNKTELDFREDIDLSIFIIKNFKNLKLEFDNNENLKSYYINKLIEKNILAFPKNIIDLNFDLDIKLLKLIKFYKRVTYKLKNALYFLFFVIKNKNDLKKKILKKKTENQNKFSKKLKENKTYKNNDSNKSDFIDNKFTNILDIEVINSLPVITNKKYSPGKFSEITFFEIDDQNKTEIEKKINLNIENIIVKKKYIFKKNFQENNNYYIIEKFGGIKNLFQREVKCLQSLFKLKHFPLLLAADYDNLEIYMNYCGENLKENNIPDNWKEQIDSIITSLNEVDIYNNDFWINNLLVHKKILYMIDFGFSSFFEEDFPFVNIDKDELNIATDLIMLLDNAMIKSIEKRLLYF